MHRWPFIRRGARARRKGVVRLARRVIAYAKPYQPLGSHATVAMARPAEAFEKRWEMVSQVLQEYHAASFCDLGCAEGYYARRAASEHGLFSIGIDSEAGMVGFAWNALKEAYYGEETDRLMLLTYETLTREPKEAMAAVYDFIGEAPFAHDFDKVDYAEAEFDVRLGTPGLHSVAAKVRPAERQAILPPDLFRRFENDSFWTDPKLNPRGVRMV